MENEKDRVIEEQAEGANQEVGASAQEESATIEAELEELRQENDKLRADANDLLDKYRRTLADFVNYRKRQDRDKEQQTTLITADVLRRIVPIIDDLDRALKNIPAELSEQGWVEGIVLIKRKMDNLLREFHVEPIEAVGKPFDPNYHSALLQEHSQEYPAGVVMEELEKGYQLGDYVLRPTLVKVSSGPDSDEKK